MNHRIRAGLVGIVFIALGVGHLRGQDLREQFGTNSLPAAQSLAEGIQLVQGDKPAAALVAIEKAIAADADLQMAYYWKALALIDSGKIGEAAQTYTQLVGVAERTRVTSVTIDGCVNAGLMLSKSGDEKAASLWFSKAVLLDPEDRHHLQWKAFRNMAISRAERGDHLSAGLCAIQAFQANPDRVEPGLFLQELERARDTEWAQVLSFAGGVPPIEPGERKTEIGEATRVEGIPWPVTRLLVAGPYNRLLALGNDRKQFAIIDCARSNAVTTVDVPNSILTGAFVNAELYLVLKGEGLARVEVKTGKVLQKWAFENGEPTSIAVFPARGIACCPIKGMLNVLDLERGKLTETIYPATEVEADPRQDFCYTYVKPESRQTAGHVIINGRPVLLQPTKTDWQQTALFKFAITNKRLFMAEGRMNAASNGRLLYVSPDANWVAVVGGGGWRPEQAGGLKSGYGVAVFPSHEFAKPRAFFQVDAYPTGMAANPVTQQIVVVRDTHAKVFSPSGEGAFKVLEGPHSGAAAWSPDGKTLYLADKDGLRAWSNSLLEADAARVAWFRGLEPARTTSRTAGTTEAKALDEFREFAVKDQRQDVLAILKQADELVSTTKPTEWLQFEPYQRDAALRDLYRSIAPKQDRGDAGIRIYQLEKAKQSHADQPGIDFLLGMNHFFAGHMDEASKAHLAAIHVDLARTNITIEALRCLGQIAKRDNKPMAAAYCYAYVLRLDAANPTFRSEAEGMFELASLKDEAKAVIDHLAKAAGGNVLPEHKSDRGMPRLAVAEGGQVLAAEKLFASCAPSIVAIRTATGGGSGLCVAEKGVVLTNEHVVRDARGGELTVQTFELVNGKIARAKVCRAKILYASHDHDLALLEVADPPASLTPLAFCSQSVTEGNRVYALGSPGLGRQVLEQSISDGIVSSSSRELAGKNFLQHTAAVNPGNSGGPLLNDRGQVVGIVTLKADLENVSFAIPASRVIDVVSSKELAPANPKK